MPKEVFCSVQAVLYACFFFGALGVVEAVERSHEIARDASDTLERNVREMVLRVDEIAVKFEIYAAQVLVGIFCAGTLYIVVHFLRRELSSRYVYIYH